jgi:multiple sugar transport system ATP-binding protein
MADLGAFRLPVAANARGSGAVTFGVRPENVILAAGAPGEARVFDIEDQGVVKVLVLDVGATRLHVTVPAGTHVRRDELVRFGWKPDRVVTFDAATGSNLALS